MPRNDEAPKPGAYDFTRIEAKWRAFWDERQTFAAPNPGDPSFDPQKPKFYVLDMFPYPSGAGLHVGHPLGYIATDIYSRYLRMHGYHVLHPMGWDSFGLPAEQYAIETGVHPAVTTRRNIETYRRQLKLFGFSYDWSREIATTDPAYFRWTQWIFLQLYNSWYDEECEWTDAAGRRIRGQARPISELVPEFESGRRALDADARGSRVDRPWSDLNGREQQDVLSQNRLAYMDEVPVNWCPALGTVLANEEVTNEGRSERGNHPVFRRPLRQWMLRITKYADRLLADLETLDWPEAIKLMQRNWIGRSEGAIIRFPLAELPGDSRPHVPQASCLPVPQASSLQDAQAGCRRYISVFTTRPDTVFGATYMVLAPEHPLVEQITTAKQRDAVRSYVGMARNRTDLERTAEAKEKTGVFTGAYAINPANGERIPVWIADYVLMGYGTGAIMAVPGSDERDFEFARAFDLPIVAVVSPTADWMTARVQTMTAGIENVAREGFDQVSAEFPEFADRIHAHQAAAAHLERQTVQTLLERVGVSRLIEHRNRHPRIWGAAFCDEGITINSPPPQFRPASPAGPVCDLNGLPTADAKRRITAWLEEHGLGERAVRYKLRDWIFSRQKYWGEPFPILHGPDGEIVALDESELPVELPPMEDFKPTVSDDPSALPEPPLSRAADWVRVQRSDPRTGDVKEYRRDTNTMPQWAGSCWYYLRYLDPRNDRSFCGPDAERHWMQVDLYVGGAEHAVLHLLYARFWHKVLFDLGRVSTPEPFQRLINQGMVQSFAYRDRRGATVGWDQVAEQPDGTFTRIDTGEPVTQVVAKMSKSLKNVVNPDEIIADYGADTFRMYEMYMGPIESSKPWNTRDVPGLFKLLNRIWRLVVDDQTGVLAPALVDDPPDEPTLRLLHKTIKKVTADVEAFKFNTAIAAIFDFVNALTPQVRRPRGVIEPFVLLLAPLAPHIAEELWQRLGHEESLAYHPWPSFDEALAKDAQIEIPVQICGKLRSRVTVPADADEEALRNAALADEKVRSELAGRTVRKVITVKGRLVNIVT